MRKKIIWWSLIVIWCIFIFTQSSKPAVESSVESTFFAEIISNLFGNRFDPGEMLIIETIIRKLAHFLEYSVLGLLLINGFLKKDKLAWNFKLSILAGVLYAISDEIHQIFVPGRACRIFDVCIDTAGILLGTFIVYRFAERKWKQLKT